MQLCTSRVLLGKAVGDETLILIATISNEQRSLYALCRDDFFLPLMALPDSAAADTGVEILPAPP